MSHDSCNQTLMEKVIKIEAVYKFQYLQFNIAEVSSHGNLPYLCNSKKIIP